MENVETSRWAVSKLRRAVQTDLKRQTSNQDRINVSRQHYKETASGPRTLLKGNIVCKDSPCAPCRDAQDSQDSLDWILAMPVEPGHLQRTRKPSLDRHPHLQKRTRKNTISFSLTAKLPTAAAASSTLSPLQVSPHILFSQILTSSFSLLLPRLLLKGVNYWPQ